VAALSTGAATNLRRVKENWDRDFGREEDEMAEVGQGRTLSGDLLSKFLYFFKAVKDTTFSTRINCVFFCWCSVENIKKSNLLTC
jgi:hypothetical protein